MYFSPNTVAIVATLLTTSIFASPVPNANAEAAPAPGRFFPKEGDAIGWNVSPQYPAKRDAMPEANPASPRYIIITEDGHSGWHNPTKRDAMQSSNRYIPYWDNDNGSVAWAQTKKRAAMPEANPDSPRYIEIKMEDGYTGWFSPTKRDAMPDANPDSPRYIEIKMEDGYTGWFSPTKRDAMPDANPDSPRYIEIKMEDGYTGWFSPTKRDAMQSSNRYIPYWDNDNGSVAWAQTKKRDAMPDAVARGGTIRFGNEWQKEGSGN